MTPYLLTEVIAAAPAVVGAAVYAILQKRRLAAEENRESEPPFASVDLPAPGFLLRRFNHEERNYLLRSKKTLLVFFAMLCWVLTVSFCGGLLPSAIEHNNYYGFNGALKIWSSYLDQFVSMSFIFYGMIPMIVGAVSVVDIAVIAQARFPRSRPLSRRFLFWSRVLPVLGACISGFVLAALLSLLVLRVSYGPVYSHLHDAAVAQPNTADPSCGCDGKADLFATSLPRLFLSQATTALVGFSLAVAVMMLPFQFQRRPILGFLVMACVIGYQYLFFYISFFATSIGRYIFLYTQTGPPPPYAYALIPILLSTALLLLASKFSNRLEV
jgi:hypothetical protein